MLKKSLLLSLLGVQLLTSISPVFAGGSGLGHLPPLDDEDEAGPSASIATFVGDPQQNQPVIRTVNLYPDSLKNPFARFSCMKFNFTLVGLPRDAEHPERWNDLCQAWYSTEGDQTQNRAPLYPTLFEIARNAEDPEQWNAVYALWDSGDAGQTEYRLALRPFLFEAARNPMHPEHRWAWDHLWSTKNEETSTMLRLLFLGRPQIFEDPQYVDDLKQFWFSGDAQEPENRQSLHPHVLALAQSEGHPDQWWAIGELWDSGDVLQEENRRTLQSTLLTIAHDRQNANQWKVMRALLSPSDPDQQAQNVEALRVDLLEIAQSKEHPHRWEATHTLWHETHGNTAEENHLDLYSFVREIAVDPHNPNQWAAINMLVSSSLGDRDCQIAFLERTLFSAAQDPTHPHQWNALSILWHQENPQQTAETRWEILPSLLAISKNPRDPHQWEAMSLLWSACDHQIKDQLRPFLLEMFTASSQPSRQWTLLKELWELRGDQQEETRAQLRPLMREIARDFKNPYQFDALCYLLESRGGEEAQTRIEMQPVLVEIARTSGHSAQRYAIQLLRESNDPAEQELGLALQLQYFPLYFSSDLEAQINVFNAEIFRQHARPPLADLSEEPMDLVAEFAALMDQVNPADENHPFYLQVSAITGDATEANVSSEENTEQLWNIWQWASGFLKTLTNQPLSEGETGGWQMYDENKPALINALKHIVHALNREADPQTRLANLGIVLNGILYCPTGQAEGINSVVNTLIYGQNRTAEGLEHKIHLLVQDALYHAFLGAFHEGGGVHNIARARMVIGAHLGLSQAVEGFRERISQLSDAEIPGILRTFYALFSPEFLADYLRNNTQTADDLTTMLARQDARITRNRVLEQQLAQQVDQHQRERPLLNGELAGWFVEHGLEEQLTEFGFDAEGSGVLNQDGALEILKILRYVGR